MSAKAIREYDGSVMLARWLGDNSEFKIDPNNFVTVNPHTVLEKLPAKYPWLTEKKLVVKPDQLIKRRGKAGLINLGGNWQETVDWITARRGKEIKVESVSGVLDHFIIVPFFPHKSSDEYYICINSNREGDEILFHHEGGVDIGDVDSKAKRMQVDVDAEASEADITSKLLSKVPTARQPYLAAFIKQLHKAYATLHFSYLEINPLVVTDDKQVVPLDLAAKIDETARFEVGKFWGKVDFPPPFGRAMTAEEAFIHELDGQTGASLKLTILNPKGRIWCMVAGGGASVIYADTLTDLGAGEEIANYGEYSGAPTEAQTFEYASTILKLMTQEAHAQGKILLIGGGIANFTNVAETFKGIIRAITKYAETLRQQKVKIYVRRGGPNYQEGLEKMRDLSEKIDLPIEVFGPEVHMTSIVSLALGKPIKEYEAKYLPKAAPYSRVKTLGPQAGPAVPATPKKAAASAAAPAAPASSSAGSGNNTPSLSPSSSMTNLEKAGSSGAVESKAAAAASAAGEKKEIIPAPATAAQATGDFQLFTQSTRALIFGMQPGAVQNMLDFDFICGRQKPSVAGMVYPFTANHLQKFYWNTQEVLIPIYQLLDEAIQKNPDVDCVVNFSSFRSVFETTVDILKYPQIKTIAIIAEGVPERRSRQLHKMAKKNKVTIIGPATVGGIKPGCFRIGNTGGMLDNIISSKLYRPGSVAYVARSGGMSNELNNIISRNADGVYEGIAIGGDRYPGTTFIDHLRRFQANPDVKMMVVLGEVGGVEEYEICRAIEQKQLTKPIVAWCIGTCAKIFPYEVQFGHAGACARGQAETADDKNKALRLRGVFVPNSFEDFGVAINTVYSRLVEEGVIKVRDEGPVPTIPVDYDWARKLGLIRKPSAFVSSIVDERGDELVYAGMKISEVFKSNLGVGGVVGLIWFRKRLPDYFCRFIEMVLMVTADHGPAVAGAHNTIVCARAGKDLISSLVSGLLTIGPRFGGALDGAALKFATAYDSGATAEDFVNQMRNNKELIPGIGHRVKSLENPDARVVIIKSFVRKHFKSSEVFDYALEVEKVTTKKKSNLILNVDGAIATAFVDLLRSCGAFTNDEVTELLNIGCLNGLFVLGRSIGFIGHYIDQNRLKQGLYRHPTEDISYIIQENLGV